jgi:hypothetical protein
LWTVQAGLMFSLAETVTKSRPAAALATLFYGWEMPLVLGDGPYNAAFFERSLCMAPYLWGLKALFQGRRWEAVLGNSLSTYLHATPAIYIWPLIAWEDWAQAWRDPRLRKAALVRWACAAAILGPLFFAISSDKMTAMDPEFLRMGVRFQGSVVAGVDHIFPDKLFMAGGFLLIGLAAWRLRELPAMPVLLRLIGTCLAFMALGRIAYAQFLSGGPLFWLTVVRMQPWVSLCVLELLGGILLAGWIAAELERDARFAPAFLFMLALPPFMGHDFLLRAAAVLAAAFLLARKGKAVGALALAAAAVSLAHWAWPDLFPGLAARIGLRGGMFRLPIFRAQMGLGLLACLLMGLAADRFRKKGRYPALAPSCAGLVLLLAAAGSFSMARTDGMRREDSSDKGDLDRMRVWIRENTAPEASVVWSPITFGQSTEIFMQVAERSPFVGLGNMLTMRFSSLSAPLAERLAALRFEPANAPDPESLMREVENTDRRFSPELAGRLRERYGVSHVLLEAGRPWPGKPLHQEGKFVLYSIPG